jgi:hypothetical protein
MYSVENLLWVLNFVCFPELVINYAIHPGRLWAVSCDSQSASVHKGTVDTTIRCIAKLGCTVGSVYSMHFWIVMSSTYDGFIHIYIYIYIPIVGRRASKLTSSSNLNKIVGLRVATKVFYYLWRQLTCIIQIKSQSEESLNAEHQATCSSFSREKRRNTTSSV